MTEFAIEFQDVIKDYGLHRAVDQVSFKIRKGELVTFLGPSGCGKTTSLRLIAGLELPTQGKLFIQGQDVSQRSASERNVGMVFQSYALFPHMTVLDNVAYGPVIRGVNKKDAHQRAHEILEQIGLKDLGARLPAELSGGQQQRVAVARAIVQQPDVLLFDEPLSNVDAKLRRRVRAEIRQLQQEFGLTAVYVTHDQEEALAVSDRIVVMSAGKIEQIGTPEDLYDRPSNGFVADFIGDANILQGTLSEGRFVSGNIAIAVKAQDISQQGAITVSIRPERIWIQQAEPSQSASEPLNLGEVSEATYLGSRMEYMVKTQTSQLLISRPIAEQRFSVGAQVMIGIKGADLSLMR